MKRLIVLALLVSLAGCSDSNSPTLKQDLVAQRVKLPEGGSVMCVFFSPSSYAAAMSCDWKGQQ